MKTIVLGGAGFIGSHLTEHLLKEGHAVTVIDNLSTGRLENLSHLKKYKDLCFINADITDFEKIFPNFKSIEWIFHLAGLADIVPSIQKPLVYHRSNVSGTVNALEASRLAGVKKFVYAASSSCYGIPDIFPTSETCEISPRYPYALTKYLGEECVFYWGKAYKLPVVSLRLFNVYGLRYRTTGAYGAVFGVFLAQKLAGKPFTVVGDGTQARDFVYVTDVVRAFVAAAQSNIANEVFNVGSGSTYSINYLVELLGGTKVHIPKRPGEPDCTHADISKIKKMLGWKPQVSFEEGVKRLLVSIGCQKEVVYLPGIKDNG